MGQKGKGTRHGCLERVLIRHGWYARKGSVVDEPESSTGMERHDVHGMAPLVVAVWPLPGVALWPAVPAGLVRGQVGSITRACFLFLAQSPSCCFWSCSTNE